ncbi:MAG: S1C family serine protease [Candidatus Omnitrophota bacterium]
MSPVEIMGRYGDAVVMISTESRGEKRGVGSGFIVKETGVIVTNYHVIKMAQPAVVKLGDGRTFREIYLISYDEKKDIAVIKIPAEGLPAVKADLSGEAKVGEKVSVIGNPRGLKNTISDGLLSQIRDTGKGFDIYQISAPISPGSSGGPVFNAEGEVVGIATSGYNAAMGQNLNFAVPMKYAAGMIDGEEQCTLEEFAKREKRNMEKALAERAAKEDKKKGYITIYDFSDGLQGWGIPAWALSIPSYVTRSVQPSGEHAVKGDNSLQVYGNFSGARWQAVIAEVQQPLNLTKYSSVSADVYVPEDAPKGLYADLGITFGRDLRWVYMNKPVSLLPGRWSRVEAGVAPGADGWREYTPDGKFRKTIKRVNVRVFKEGDVTYEGPVYIDNVCIRKK